MENQVKIRRYEFDWLRVLAFGLLIFYHTGMFFVSWDWHIKNNAISQTLEWPMLFLSQWRMSLIFLISGAGVYFALGYRSAFSFAKDRIRRIFFPLVVGILVVVPPQVYVERLTQGFSGNYLEFYPTVFSTGPYPEGNFSWHHLWYLAYILVYSLGFLPLLLWLRRHPLPLGRISNWVLLTVPVVWLSLGSTLYLPFPGSNALINDWGNHFLYCSIFLFGFLLISSPQLQDNFRKMRLVSFLLAFTTVILLYSVYWLPSVDLTADSEIYIYLLLKSANRWFWLLAIVGYALQYLSYKWKYLPLANEMVYPFYILHQTVIVLLGYYLREANWSIALKYTVIATGTFLICFLLIRLVLMQVNWLRVPFGLKPIRRTAAATPRPQEEMAFQTGSSTSA